MLAASDAWRWVPPGARTYDIDGVSVIDYPAWAFTSFYVTPLDTGRDAVGAQALVEQISQVAAEQGESSTTWWLSPTTRPIDLAEVLLGAGATLTETCDIYAFDLTDRLPDAGPTTGVQTRLVTDEATFDDYETVGARVWDAPRADPVRRAAQLADLAGPLDEQDSWRAVAYVDDRPVAIGGTQLVDGVARLWGAGTV